ncbi:Zeta toxin [Candidatus Rubidus massiliensis]|nr:Zeta toxin [Candidatus Rubidus massiliensis]
MNKGTLRLRMFAGPNGSGKSTFKSIIRPELLGMFINPDEIEKEIRDFDFLDLDHYEIQTTEEEILNFFIKSPLLKTADLLDDARELRFNDDKLSFFNAGVNSYFASVAADFIRHKLIECSKSFTFETVMSFPDKIEFLRTAQSRGYRTYLYYVATEDPAINISRVRYRVRMGGHSVPEDKIISRYKRSLDLLKEAIPFTNRAYIFDNSTHEHIWLAEITDGHLLEMKTDLVPAWFKKALGSKFDIESKRSKKL